MENGSAARYPCGDTMSASVALHKNDKFWGAVLHDEHLPSSPKLVYVFCLLDRREMELTRI
jgi:hypothetical protein